MEIDSFKIHTANYDNLLHISREQSALFEQRICELSEIASSFSETALRLLSVGMTVFEACLYLSQSFSLQVTETHASILDRDLPRARKYLYNVDTLDRALFSELLCNKLEKANHSVTEKDFLSEAKLPDKFVYVKNQFSDEAYDVISQDYKDPRVWYAKTLRDAVKMLSDGDVSYCLLPLEERGGARIGTVSQLIFSEDLKINAVTPVFGMDGTADMKYAVVSKKFTVPEKKPDDDRYLEIRISAEDSIALSELIAVSDFFHHTVYRINTVTFETDAGPSAFISIVIRDEGREFTPLLMFLTLFGGACTPVGIYKNLE